MCLSSKQKKAFSLLHDPLLPQDIRSSLYAQDLSIVLGRLWISCAKNFNISKDQALQDWQVYSAQILSFVPVAFPLNGTLLLAQGVLQKHIGMVLAEVKAWWIEHQETPQEPKCLSYALTVAKKISNSALNQDTNFSMN